MTLRAIPIPTETTGAALTEGTKHNRPLFPCCGGSARMGLLRRIRAETPDCDPPAIVTSDDRGFDFHLSRVGLEPTWDPLREGRLSI